MVQLQYILKNPNEKLPADWLDAYSAKGDTLDILLEGAANGAHVVYATDLHSYRSSVYTKNSYTITYHQVGDLFYITLKDSLLQPVNNAQVFDKKQNTGIITQVNGELGLYELSKTNQNPIREHKIKTQKYATMAILSQSQYRHGDTLRASILALKGKKKYKEGLIVKLEQQERSWRYRSIQTLTLQPNANGLYEVNMPLADSLLLDKSYRLSYRLGKKIEVLDFALKDYELDKTNVSVNWDNTQTDSTRMLISVVDNNGFARIGTKVTVTAKARVSNLYVDRVFVPDTLWYEHKIVTQNKPLSITVPDSLLQKIESNVDFKITIKTLNGEVFEEQRYKFFNKKEPKLIITLDSMLRVHFDNADSATTAEVTYYIGDNKYVETIQLPYAASVNPSRRYTSVLAGKKSATLNFPTVLTHGANQTGEKLAFFINKYHNQDIDYELYKNEKIIEQGNYTDTVYTHFSPKECYWLRYHYMLNGRVHTQTIAVSPTDHTIHVELTKPETAQPGEKVTYSFLLTDADGKPVADAVIMGTSVSSQMKGEISTLDPGPLAYYSTINNDGPNYTAKPNLTRRTYTKEISPSTINLKQYQEIFHPKEDIYFNYVPLDSQYHSPRGKINYGQVWVHITDAEGKPIAVHKVHVNGLLHYDKALGNPSSILYRTGKHILKIRTHNRQYILKEVEVRRNHKTIVSFSIDGVVPGNKKMRKRLTKWEKKESTQNLILFQNTTTYDVLVQQVGGFSQQIEKRGSWYRAKNSVAFLGPNVSGSPIEILLDNGVRHTVSFQPYTQYIITEAEVLQAPLKVQAPKGKLAKYNYGMNPLQTYHPYKTLNLNTAKNAKHVTYTTTDISLYRDRNFRLFTPQNKNFDYLVAQNKTTGKTQMYRSNEWYGLDTGRYDIMLVAQDSFVTISAVQIRPGGKTYVKTDGKMKQPNTAIQATLNQFDTRLLFNQKIKNRTGIALQLKSKGGDIAVRQKVKITQKGEQDITLVSDDLGLIFIPLTASKPVYCSVVQYCGDKETIDFSIDYQAEMGLLWKEITLECTPRANSRNATTIREISANLNPKKRSRIPWLRNKPTHANYTQESTNWKDPTVFARQSAANADYYGNGISFLGSRADATAYFVDGVRVIKSLPSRNLNSIAITAQKKSVNLRAGVSRRFIEKDKNAVFKEAPRYMGYDDDAAEVSDFNAFRSASFDKNKEVYEVFSVNPAPPEIVVRDNFSDLGFWIPFLQTNENGVATFTTQLPDDIATWESTFIITDTKRRTTAVTSSLKSYKPVMAQLHTPRFLVAGDSTTLRGELSNTTGDSLTLFSKFTLASQATEGNTHTVGNAHFVYQGIQLDPLSAADELEVEFSTTDGVKYTDGERRSIPIFPQGMLLKTGNLYEVPANATRQMVMPESDSSYVLVATSPRDLLIQQLRTVVDYEYNCNEQIASKLRASLLLLKDESNTAKQKRELTKNIKKHITTLEQNETNGYWGWWPNAPVNLWMTCYIVEALDKARQAGYDVDLDFDQTYLTLSNVASYRNSEYYTTAKILHTAGYMKAENLYTKLHKSKKVEDQILTAKMALDLGIDSSFRVLDSLQNKDVLGHTYWGVDTLSFGSESLRNTCDVYTLLRGRNTGLEESTRKYLWSKVYAYQKLNTYEKIWLAEALYQDEKTITRNVPCLLTDAQGTRAVADHQKTTVSSGSFEVKNPNGREAYVMTVTENWVKAPQRKDSTIAVSTDYSPQLKAGEPTPVTVTIQSTNRLGYVQLQVPMPAGCSYYGSQQIPGATHAEFYKHKVIIYVENVPSGKTTFTFDVLPKYTGTYTLNPASAELMYFPIFNGNNEVRTVEVK